MTPEQEAARLFAGGAPIVLSDGRTIVRDPENPGRAFVIPRAPTLAEMFARTTEEIREQSPFMFSSMLGGCGPVLDRMAKRAQAFEVEQHGRTPPATIGRLSPATQHGPRPCRPPPPTPRSATCIPQLRPPAVLAPPTSPLTARREVPDDPA